MPFILFFDQISNTDVAVVGGKNASLGEMYQNLSAQGIRVPFGFATTAHAYQTFLTENKLTQPLTQLLSTLDYDDVNSLADVAKKIRSLILSVPLPKTLTDTITQGYRTLSAHYNLQNIDVAVRSSATAEDLPDASFAGQQESFLNISGEERLIEHVHRCYASLYTDRAISYRHRNGFDHMQVSLCVGIQKMVRSDQASSGVMFTIDPDSGSDSLIIINSTWGLGENIVGGKINPDEFIVFKPTLNTHTTILKRTLGSKLLQMIYDPNDLSRTLNIDTPVSLQEQFCLNDEEVMTLARNGLTIEQHYSTLAGSQTPMDIEWAKDALDGQLYIVQARPETVQSRKEDSFVLLTYKFDTLPLNKILLTGTAVGNKIAHGRVRVIHDISEFHLFQEGEILVTDNTDPDWEPVMKKASALITNRGGRTCHAAIIAREIGVSAIVGTTDATTQLLDGQEVTISCAQGETGYIYEGIIPYHVDSLDLSDCGEPKTRLYLNIGDPQNAFHSAQLPNHGVGLARMEFIINNTIKAHPLALIDIFEGKRPKGCEEIHALMHGYDTPKEFFQKKIMEGVGTICATFYPKPVIVRTSDFKTNEYRHMIGGEAYEEHEENPMIGFRGASRYNSQLYKKAFEWECEALRMVRDEMGLNNMQLMLPFVRTPQEGRDAIAIMNTQGLVQGVNDLKIYAMCEIPSNVILADEFLKIFDGYSIGSNDLTQLTLGVDRDSAQVASIFDERNEAVKRMIKMAIDACQKEGKYIGICGQAPSDYPEITRFLVEAGIDSISLNPDSIVKTWKHVVELENSLT
ncbi:MAG TPA: phosphoenolpyruvate synthase [Sulfuricurvum sp.]|nr:MAG: phosphoenolpyruvate synthase [Campylobacterales bacterium 16-40-21]OZA04139.1 MAG: phosphoenolpyruvate synthase [Sulfuricurvum sp. 17-40-25]HQS66147.1 phosphoenolpyruvate synthase [Sulfuricurvum sp.]HQT35511.1 phosphoenolpyruvate synthase [Sulfuricurvum sp.]